MSPMTDYILYTKSKPNPKARLTSNVL